MRVYLAGASGVLGRRVLADLVAVGHEVTAATRTPSKVDELREAGAEPVVCDALDAAGLRMSLMTAHPEVVVNLLTDLPAKVNPRRIDRDLAANDRLREQGTRNLLAGARAAGARRLVAQSSAGAYAPALGATGLQRLHSEEDPLDLDAFEPWRRSVRALAELERAVLEDDGPEGIVLRYGWLYGPATPFAPGGAIAERIGRGRFPIGAGGQAIWSFAHIEDAATATVLAVEGDSEGVFNVVDDDPAPISDWLPALAWALEAPAPKRLPLALVSLLGGPYAAHLMTSLSGADNRRARQELGFVPAHPSWREGFREALG